jgi:hypothetical protein
MDGKFGRVSEIYLASESNQLFLATLAGLLAYFAVEGF